MFTSVYDAFGLYRIKLGDQLESLERGDIVEVRAIGDKLDSRGNTVPLVMLHAEEAPLYNARTESTGVEGIYLLKDYKLSRD